MNGANGKMIELLERIANGLDATNQRLDATNQRLDATNQRLDAGFASINGRLDNVIGFLGAHHADHEQRIQALEARVFAKSG
jgi:ABC-type transporter Mla subunit MlaD